MTFYFNKIGELLERYGDFLVQAPMWAFWVILGMEIVGLVYCFRSRNAVCPELYIAMVLAFPFFGTILVIAANYIILSKLYHGNDRLRFELNFRRRIVPIIAAVFIGDIIYVIFDSMGKNMVDHYTDEMLIVITAAFITAIIIFLREYRKVSSTNHYVQFAAAENSRTLREKDDIGISGLPAGTIFTEYKAHSDECIVGVIDNYRTNKYTVEEGKTFDHVCSAYMRNWYFRYFTETEFRNSCKDVISSEYIGKGVEKLTVCNIRQNEKTGQFSAEKIIVYRFTKGNFRVLIMGAALMALTVFYCTPAWVMVHTNTLGLIGRIFGVK